MDWQAQQQQAYQQQKAERQAQEAQAAEMQRLRLKSQFEEQQRRQVAHQARLEQEALEKEQASQQQVALAQQRIADDLKRTNQERAARQREARDRAKQQQAQETKVWASRDGKTFRSPRECEFWDAWIEDSERANTVPLIPQHPIGKYRVDFAHLDTKTIVEVDGRFYHTARYAFNNDRVRQRALEKQGWSFIRFSGDEVSTNAEGCVIEAYTIIRGK